MVRMQTERVFFFFSFFLLLCPCPNALSKKRITLVSLNLSTGHLITAATLATHLIHLPCHFRLLISSLPHPLLLTTMHSMVTVIWTILCLTQTISPATWATVTSLTINPVVLTLILTVIMMTQMIKTDPLTGIGFDRWYQIFSSSLALPLSLYLSPCLFLYCSTCPTILSETCLSHFLLAFSLPLVNDNRGF